MNETNELKLDTDKREITSNTFQQSLKWLIPIVLILITAFFIYYFLNNEPEKKKKKNNGTVSPRTQSFLVSQVNGQVTYVSEQLREGSFFEKGTVLLKVDNRDYLADIKIEESGLASAKQALAEEMVLSAQAALDWKKLGNNSEPNDLVLRKPQQEVAKSRLASAQAALAKAKLTLERTQIIAPYDGRVLEKAVDLGQVATANTHIAEIYATDFFEVRLPLRNADLKFVDLPKIFQDDNETHSNTTVEVYSSLSDSHVPWTGRLVRTESAIDNDARQLHVVMQIDDPYNAGIVERTPLKIGEYVTAKIKGKVIDSAIVIPSESIYQNTYVYVGVLRFFGKITSKP